MTTTSSIRHHITALQRPRAAVSPCTSAAIHPATASEDAGAHSAAGAIGLRGGGAPVGDGGGALAGHRGKREQCGGPVAGGGSRGATVERGGRSGRSGVVDRRGTGHCL